MPSLIALLLCSGAVFYLLRNEQRQLKGVSRVSWIPTLWMLYYAGKPLGRWLDPHGDIDDAAGSPADRYFLLTLIAAAIYIISKRRLNWRNHLHSSAPFVCLLAYMMVSCVWSPTAASSFKQWVRVLGSMLMALVILTEKEPTQVLQSIFRRTTYIFIPLSATLIKYYPDLGVEYRDWNGEKFWVGACLQKNGLGRLCLVCAIFLVWTFIRRWKKREGPTWKHQNKVEIALLLTIGWLLRGPGNNYPMTAIAVLFLCAGLLALLLALKRPIAERVYGGVAIATVSLGLIMAFMSVTGTIPSMGTESLGRDATFTGRVDIWNGVRQVAWQSPIFGVGYAGYWSKHHEFPNVGIVNEGHNGYLDTFVETGAMGLVLLLFTFISYAKRASREKSFDFDWASFRIVFLLMLLLHNFTESSLLRASTHLWVLYIYMYVMFPMRRRAVAAPSPASAAGFTPPHSTAMGAA
jgi:exopolysaccharide production protein ExoQ